MVENYRWVEIMSWLDIVILILSYDAEISAYLIVKLNSPRLSCDLVRKSLKGIVINKKLFLLFYIVYIFS